MNGCHLPVLAKSQNGIAVGKTLTAALIRLGLLLGDLRNGLETDAAGLQVRQGERTAMNVSKSPRGIDTAEYSSNPLLALQ